MRRLAILTLLFASSCAKDDAPPPFISGDCTASEDVTCRPPGSVGGVIQFPDGGTGPGNGGETDAGSKTLAGSVATVNDLTFSARSQYTNEGTVAALGENGYSVSAGFSGPDFSLPNAQALRAIWVAATPADGVPDVMQTIAPVDGRAEAVTVDIARRSLFTDVVALATAGGTPQSLRSDRAQIVLTFVDANGVPLEGVQIVRHGGAAVLYDVAGTYSDVTTTATESRGVAIIVNEVVPSGSVSSGFPGNRVTIIGSRTTTTQQQFAIDVYAARGSVTFATVTAP